LMAIHIDALVRAASFLISFKISSFNSSLILA